MAPKVLIPQDISAIGKNYLIEKGYEVKMGSGISEDVLINEVADCEALLLRSARITEAVMNAGTKLKVISKHGVGIDNIDLSAAKKRGIKITNAPASNSSSVAEHTIMLILAVARYMLFCCDEMRRGNFEVRNECLGSELAGKTLAVIGLGKIGSAVAKRAHFGLEMNVIGYDPASRNNNSQSEWVKILDSIEEVLPTADFITLHLPLSAATHHLIDRRLIDLMKKKACIINASRGEIIDERALLEALQSGRIAGAALDVLETEPPPRDHPFLRMKNVIVTPHNAALTMEATERMALHAAMGIDEVLSGKPPTWPVKIT